MADISADETASDLSFMYLRHICAHDVYMTYMCVVAVDKSKDENTSRSPPKYLGHICTRIYIYMIYL